MSAPQSYSELIYIGQIKKSHGTKGEVSALLLTDNKYIFDQIQQVFLIKDEKKKDQNEMENISKNWDFMIHLKIKINLKLVLKDTTTGYREGHSPLILLEA